MKQDLLSFLKVFLPFILFLFIIQYTVVNYLNDYHLYYSTYSIYIFHFLATFSVYTFVVFVHKSFADKSGFAFMGASFFKMIAAVLFLLPMLLSDSPSKFVGVLAFFIPYFLFLIFETFFVVRIINQK